MKKILLVLLILGAMASVAGCILGLSASCAFAANTLKGSGRIVTRTVDLPAFHAVDASRAVKVLLTEAGGDKIRIEADDNLIDLVKVEVVKGCLRVGFDKSVQNISNADVKVTVPAAENIRALEVSSAARIVCEPTLTADQLSLDASSAGRIVVSARVGKCSLDASSASRIEATLDAGECDIELSSAARIELAGKADKCRADLSSASKLSAEEFVVVDCEVDTSSAAKASVNCSGKLSADASSGSSIRYRGDCGVRASKSSGGSVTRD